MSSQQFSFFMDESDQRRFNEALRASGDIAFLPVRPSVPYPDEIQTSAVSHIGREALTIMIVRRDMLDDIVFKNIVGTEKYFADVTTQPFIEFTRCYYTDIYIRSGRFFRNDSYWDADGKLTKKSTSFIGWAQELFRIGKRSLTKIEDGYYAGDGALKRRGMGVVFEGLDIKATIPKM